MPPSRRDLVEHDAVRDQLLRETRQMPTRARSPRLILGGLAATLVAGAAATAIAVVPSGGGGQPTIAPVAATEVLDRASKAAGGLPDFKPRADQYLYMLSKSRQRPEGEAQGRTVSRVDWRSADGRHAGLTSGGDLGRDLWLCENSREYEEMLTKSKAAGIVRPKVDLAKPPQGCHSAPVMLSGLPTTVQGMRSWLYKNSRGGNPADVQAFITLSDTLLTRYVRPSSLALMFKAAGAIPGVTVTRNVTDLAGRKGIAVGQTFDGRRLELIFDVKSYRYLGYRQFVSHKDSHAFPAGPKADVTPSADARYPDGTELYSYALLKVAVTDKVKQTPR
ncbi:CU044_5270 family protein [Actinomadura harenae]|nr:CU044_5270 family protein [Actinomadura harenae]